jgi:hypothetical protein
MKLRSSVIRTILAWVPILPPPQLIAQPQQQPSPRIFLCGPECAANPFCAWSELQDRAFQRRVSRYSLHVASAESRGV